MKMSVLASGSTGNITYIESEQCGILIDVGLSCKRIEASLERIQRNIKDVKGIFITHEHSDHVKGLKVIAKKHQIPIYANENTWARLDEKNIFVDPDLRFNFNPNEDRTLYGFDISSFSVSHDAVDPQFYTFKQNNKKVSIITDTGYVSDRMKGAIEDSNAIVFESNHDVDMLRLGRYPWNTKQRILSDNGHLSNEDAAHAMKDVINDRTARIYLSHLSQDNNIKELARMSVESVLNQYDIDTKNHVMLCDTDKDTPTSIYQV